TRDDKRSTATLRPGGPAPLEASAMNELLGNSGLLGPQQVVQAFRAADAVISSPNSLLEVSVVCLFESRMRQRQTLCDTKILHIVQDKYRRVHCPIRFDIHEVCALDIHQRKTWPGVVGSNHSVP